MNWNANAPRKLDLNEVVEKFNEKAFAMQRPEHTIRMELGEDFIVLDINGEVRKARDKARPASDAIWRLAAIGMILPISAFVWVTALDLSIWQGGLLVSMLALAISAFGIQYTRQFSADFVERVHTPLRRDAQGLLENPARVFGSLLMAYHAIRDTGPDGPHRIISRMPQCTRGDIDDLMLSRIIVAMNLIVKHYEALVSPTQALTAERIENEVQQYVETAAGYSPLLHHLWERDLVTPSITFVLGICMGTIGLVGSLTQLL